MASRIIFVTTVLCIIALSISVTASSYVRREPLTDGCLRCICEGIGTCYGNIGCKGEVCGMFGITHEYWIDSGRPSIESSKRTDIDAYQKCAKNPACARQSVFSYINKFSQDCNRDGVIDCHDYAAIHKLGGYRCKGKLSKDFKERFSACLSVD